MRPSACLRYASQRLCGHFEFGVEPPQARSEGLAAQAVFGPLPADLEGGAAVETVVHDEVLGYSFRLCYPLGGRR